MSEQSSPGGIDAYSFNAGVEAAAGLCEVAVEPFGGGQVEAAAPVHARWIRQAKIDVTAPAQSLRKLVWLETFTDRGDGSKDQDGWEADSGFGSWYTIEQYFGSDSLGWQVKFEYDVIGDHDDPDKAKESAQADFERRVLALPSTDRQTCEHGNHLETCTVCLMWRSLPSSTEGK